MRSIGAAVVLVQIAFRNLFASKARSLIVGGIVLIGSLVVVVGSAVVDTIDSSMRGSVQGSLAGHLQIYSARSKDELSLYGKMGGQSSQLEPIEEFGALRRVLAHVPNVKDVVPMGIEMAMVTTGNEFDQALEKLRADVRQGAQGPGIAARYEAHKAHLRRMSGLLRDEIRDASVLMDPDALKGSEAARERADRERAASDDFWRGFDADPLANLEFLENRIAPQSLSNAYTMIRYVGTDLESYQRAFDRVRVVEGTAIPRGQRGILVGKLFAEDWLKLRAARLLDRIADARTNRGRRIATDEELHRWVKELQGQKREILLQLDPMQAAEATARLRGALGSQRTELPDLLGELFVCDDRNFDQHRAIFYRQLAPLLQLYSVGVGDVITLKAPSRSGYMNSVNLKVYGFVEFRGLEKSTAAGYLSIMDLVSWRDLYGYMTAEKAAEIGDIKSRAGAREVERANAEAELFGESGAPVDENARPGRIETPAIAGTAARGAGSKHHATYSQEEIDSGVVLNAAVVLRDPARTREAMRDVKAALSSAHMDMKVVGWQEAAGALGQFVSLARIILFTAVFFVFAVALVIINNAMVMATLQRVKEIGTLRAIGAQKRFIIAMMLLETSAVGLAFGAAGTLLGVGAVAVIRLAGGFPATNDTMYFFFSGRSLLPHLGGLSLAISLAIVFLVSALSSLYPALIATRVTPLEAMQSDD